MKFYANLVFPARGKSHLKSCVRIAGRVVTDRPANSFLKNIIAALALLLVQRSVVAEPADLNSPGGGNGIYAGLGVAGIHGSARASGSLSERESDSSAALRLAVGYSVAFSNKFGIGAEIYDLPTHAKLGLGDQTTNILGLAALPSYTLLPDTTLFLSVGVERARTNSPVAVWHTFNTNTPVYGAGISYSFARALRIPLSLSARVERANYERITYLAQTDLFKQTRYLVSVEWHF
jgi:Outer membrane protein beta-barrel domain